MENVAIRIDSVAKSFKLPHQKKDSIKNIFLNIFNGDKTFEEQRVLKDINFDINKGDFIGIVGRNGSGKSTLLKLLAGIYSPDKGAIHVNGKLTPFIELGVGFSPELTGRENVFLNGALLGFDRKEMEAMYAQIVAFAELEKFMDQKLKNYSSGMQVRLAFSLAIRAKPDILILDEVLAVGDASFQQKCFDYFEELKSQNTTVVFVSHDMSAVQRFCNEAVYLEKGEVIKKGKPAEIADLYNEANISSGTSTELPENLSDSHEISGEIVEQTNQKAVLEIKYKSENDNDLYIAFSVLKNGVPAAELNSIESLRLKGSGSVSYHLDTSIFNAGIYQVSLALCELKNKKLLSIGKNRPGFVIKGNDLTRGGIVKLKDDWEKS